MSQENVEIVRRFMSAHEGEDLIPLIREFAERLGPEFQPHAVLAWWADDPGWQHAHPNIEWDSQVVEEQETAHGPTEVAVRWAGYLELWDSFVYRAVEYRDLGDWVLVPEDIRARGRDGVAVEMRIFVLHHVREGKVAVYRSRRTEQEALKAVGLEE